MNFDVLLIQAKCILTADQAREIYRLKFLASTSVSSPDLVGQEISNSVLLAARYGVSSKTIRDIWNRKTWINATTELCNQEQFNSAGRAYFENLLVEVQTSSSLALDVQHAD